MQMHAPQTLRSALTAGRLPVAEAVRLAVQLCDALADGHARGTAHGDVRPDNILLLPGGASIQLAGAGRIAAPRPAEYVAPECRRGWSPSHVGSDLFAVGVVLYETVVGRPPAGQFPWPGQVDPAAGWLDPIVLRCLAEDPARRYASAGELRADLLAGGRRRRPPWAMIGLVVAATVSVLILSVLVLRLAADTVSQGSRAVAMPSPAVVMPMPSIPTLPTASSPALVDLQRIMAQQRATLDQLRARSRGVRGDDQERGGAQIGQDTLLAGGVSVFGGSPFRKVAGDGRPVRGISYTTGRWGNNDSLRQVDPVYDPMADAGQAEGIVMARDGYAVGGLQIDVDDTNAVALAVVFMAYRDGHLVPNDRYVSDWVGHPENRQASRSLGGDGRTVVGLCGRQGMNLNAVGLVMATP
jgi:hypothetical protein